MESHSERIARTRQAYREAHARFVKRLTGAPAEAVERAPADGGWSAAQIGWHVAAVNTSFAALVSGERPGPQPLPEGAPETPWADIVRRIPDKIEAGKRVQPPAEVRKGEALAALETSAAALDAALAGLDPSRARDAITHPAMGAITLGQFGDWATAHVIRHNAQAKRVLGF
jgi:uncharacterized damage-inducible protein DinB